MDSRLEKRKNVLSTFYCLVVRCLRIGDGKNGLVLAMDDWMCWLVGCFFFVGGCALVLAFCSIHTGIVFSFNVHVTANAIHLATRGRDALFSLGKTGLFGWDWFDRALVAFKERLDSFFEDSICPDCGDRLVSIDYGAIFSLREILKILTPALLFSILRRNV